MKFSDFALPVIQLNMFDNFCINRQIDAVFICKYIEKINEV